MTMGIVDVIDRGAAFRIILMQIDEAAVIGLEHDGCLTKVSTKLMWSQLESFREVLAEQLLFAVRATRELLHLTNSSEIDKAASALEKVGSNIMFDLFEGPDEERFWKFVHRHLSYHPDDGPPVAYEPLLVEVEAPNELIPFGLIPAFDPGKRGPIDNLQKLRRFMFRFLGMAAVIRYVEPMPHSADDANEFDSLASIDQDRLLLNEGKLPIKFFQDGTLYGATVECEFFHDMASYIELDGPWPRHTDAGVDEETIAPKLAEALWRSSQRFDGSDRELADQIHHVSCHCRVNPKLAADYKLTLGSETCGPFEISLFELKAALHQVRKAHPKSATPSGNPLIFLNACGSSMSSPRGLPTFPRTFSASHRAVIGTETKIPDQVAASICEAFYVSLLGGSTAGQSLHHARWHLVDFHHNPLGILYTLHGDPGLRVSHPIPLLLP
ncbi:hypothetical protein ABIC03_007804 [Bradyrhizobium sp. RT6a]|uniref:CHAT domain-containing protein n=1 Tax=Bradyrhizobium sp. RT6a TaxID=3156381 RepID=UPI00339329B7